MVSRGVEFFVTILRGTEVKILIQSSVINANQLQTAFKLFCLQEDPRMVEMKGKGRREE